MSKAVPLASEEEYPKLEIDPELIPEIHLDPKPESGEPNEGTSNIEGLMGRER